MANWKWTELVADAGDPGNRTQGMGAYDPVRGYAIAYGGVDAASADTWKWNGTSWTLIDPATEPGAVGGVGTALMCYDTVREKIFMYLPGGTNWYWGGSDWEEVASTNHPGWVEGRTVCFDEANGEVLFYNSNGQTWTWDGTEWTQHAPAHSPDPLYRRYCAMAYDPISARVILFGGCDDSYVTYDDTWTWDGSDWTELAPTVTPQSRYWGSLTLDENRDRLILVGGSWQISGDDYYTIGVWSWTGTNWEVEIAPTTLSAAPYPEQGTAAQRSHARRRAIAFSDASLDGIIFSCGDALSEGNISSTILLEYVNPVGSATFDWISGTSNVGENYSITSASLAVAIKNGHRKGDAARRF